MSRAKRELSNEERRLWERVVADAKAKRGRAVLVPDLEHRKDSEHSGRPHPARHADAHPNIEPATVSVVRRTPEPPPADRAGEKRVRRGALTIDASFDLHGHTQASGQEALIRFLENARSRGHRLVIVVTGVGRGGEGVLKRRLPHWLAERPIRNWVSGFAQAHRSHGGAGAYYVFLKRAD